MGKTNWIIQKSAIFTNITSDSFWFKQQCAFLQNITKIMTDALIWIIHSPTFSNFIHFQAHFVPFLPWLYFADIFQILETLS